MKKTTVPPTQLNITSPIEACKLFINNITFKKTNRQIINDINQQIINAGNNGDLYTTYIVQLIISKYPDVDGIKLIKQWVLISRFLRLSTYHVTLTINDTLVSVDSYNLHELYRDITTNMKHGNTVMSISIKLGINWEHTLTQLISNT